MIFFATTEHVSDNEVREETKTRKKKTPFPKIKRHVKRLQPNSPQVSQKRIKRKREIGEALQVEKPKKVIHLMIYPVLVSYSEVNRPSQRVGTC